MGSLVNGLKNLVTKAAEQAEVLNVFFASVFTGKTCLQEPQARETIGKVWSKKDLPLVEEDQAMKYLDKPDIYKFRGPDGVHLWELFELTNSLLHLEGHDNWEQFLRPAGKQTSLLHEG